MLQEKLLEADRTTARINSLEIVAAESSLVSPASGNTAVLTKLVETELTVIDRLNLDAGNNNSFSTVTSSSSAHGFVDDSARVNVPKVSISFPHKRLNSEAKSLPILRYQSVFQSRKYALNGKCNISSSKPPYNLNKRIKTCYSSDVNNKSTLNLKWVNPNVAGRSILDLGRESATEGISLSCKQENNEKTKTKQLNQLEGSTFPTRKSCFTPLDGASRSLHTNTPFSYLQRKGVGEQTSQFEPLEGKNICIDPIVYRDESITPETNTTGLVLGSVMFGTR